MRFKTEDIDMLIDSLKIEDVVGEYVELHKSGSNYKGLCPFHPDTTPSFMVSPAKNICKCFVCGAGGNPISFYSQYKKIGFSESVEELSKKYKIPIRGYSESKKARENTQKYYDIMREAHNFFKEYIFTNNGREALEYLSKRDVTPKIIKDNGLGYAPNKWSELGDYLLGKGYNQSELLELGLIKQNDQGGTYDVFRHRVIFPIYSIQGEVIAFGGRTLEKDKETPKYINSPDTPIFKKGKNLYGLERASIVRKKNYAMLMEGYMDVLSSYIYGFDVALAPLGTALTEEQGELLKRYTQNIILCFDSDAAGQMATERAALILKELGFTIRVLQLQGAKDPDEYLKQYGKEEFLKCVKNSLEIFDFLYAMYAKDYDLSNLISKNNFVNRFKPFFQCVNTELEKTLYLDKLSKQVEIEKDVLKKILIDNNKKKSRKFEKDVVKENIDENENVINRVEKDTLLIILIDKDNFKYFKEQKIEGSLTKKVFKYLEENYEKNRKELIEEFVKDVTLTEKEMEEWQLLVCSVIENFSDEKNNKELLQDTFISWFRSEIESSYVKVMKIGLKEGFKIIKEIKMIEFELRKTLKFEEVLKLYEKFKEFVNIR